MKFVVLALCFLGASLSQAKLERFKDRNVPDDNDAVNDLFFQLENVLNITSDGIIGVDLAVAAKKIASLADSIRDDVSSEEVDQIISDVSSKINGVTPVSDLFDA
ncbi:uncharacterized protein LOC131941734 [Physella acuta]|uniref:uncharacterized protein LOC131941734 n=1 Tax=Physella acuta TaxID=109671 RepID=UPI0027DB99EA|nr:uncharacterized protein LOC131941734 [Physella acuta]